MYVAVVIVCVLGLTSGQPAPSFHRLLDGKVRVVVPGVAGINKVSLAVSGQRGQYTADSGLSAADGSWQITLPDVTGEDDDNMNYVLQYQNKDYIHEKKGSSRLGQGREVSAPITRRYLRRRATVVFHDDFTSGTIDPTKWKHAITGFGGGSNQVNMFTPEPANSYIKGNQLYIRPTLTVDHFGEDVLNNGVLNFTELYGDCYSIDNRGCFLRGHGHIPPIMSAMLLTKVDFKYGRVTVDAKLPKGDWLWPAIWLLPSEYHYGPWPRSGEIDIMEARGNADYQNHWTHQSLGTDYTHSAIHYGYRVSKNSRTHHEGEWRITGTTFADSYHTYWMDWTEDFIKIGVDGHTVMFWDTPPEGYWQEGGFQGDNIWAQGGRDAPFDRPFHLILDVVVGGGWFWEDVNNAGYPQPWHDHATKAEQFIQFWDARHLWEPTWHGENVAMKVRSVTLEQY